MGGVTLVVSLITGKWRSFKRVMWERGAELFARASIFEAKLYLRKHGPITVLLDNSVLGHGVTHVSVWVDTGESTSGDAIPVRTGYAARVPVHASNNDSRVYAEITYLVGLAELAQAGLVKFVTSAELQAEANRHPIGRFKGYGYDDASLFDGLEIPSIDGYHRLGPHAQEQQRKRLSEATDRRYRELVRLLGPKNDLDAWHIHTVLRYELRCFLHMDFKLDARIRKQAELSFVAPSVLTPSQLGKAIGLRPIPTFLLSYRGAKWRVHPHLHVPEQKRPSSRRDQPLPGGWREYTGETSERSGKSVVTVLPRVNKMNGLSVNYGHEPIHIQYEDSSGNWYELRMGMGDAMYLLSLLKSVQLNLDIPFPDDPRDPGAVPVRPSARTQGIA
jgi:hypothetical protein